MINFEFPFDEGWSVLLLLLMAVILALQVMWVLNTKRLSTPRKLIRLGLNVIFLLSIALLIFAPYIEKETPRQQALVYAPNIPQDLAQQYSDSLKIETLVPIEDFKGKGDVYLLGHDFDAKDLAKLYGSSVQWRGAYENGVFSHLEWEGILRQGQRQYVRGNIVVAEDTEISIHMGDDMLDSIQLILGDKSFQLQFLAKATGRNEVSLRVNGEEKGLVRYFALPNAPIHYKLLFSYPDMENRRLAEWLGTQGQNLSSSIQTSAEAQQLAETSGEEIQFYITEPSMANTAALSEAVEEGASILFTNFENTEAQILQINRALGTGFQLSRVSQEGNRQVGSNLTSLPFRFAEKPNQWEFYDGAVAYQELGGAKVGISLLENTFPIAFQGDTVRYGEIWSQILDPMRPIEGDYYSLKQPVFEGFATEIEVNSSNPKNRLIADEDTVFMASLPINSFITKGKWIPAGNGWVTLSDSLEIYIHANEFKEVHQNQLISHFLRSQPPLRGTEILTEKKPLSYWWILGLIVVSASMLWVEPRVNK
ncbi:hypothetical protein KI659_07535 [Litoribacter alkaliphilus]|uniref:Uncharacterized protein n=1 Tax=Litoribacter ruber TaxID=702568 RepID=A0AAP2G116_9BACT|nr:hypothetical protein [Litoribacter alkaliphilus]MBS9523864.1 hypothetical protein [Litoribacter alkaliphilus]